MRRRAADRLLQYAAARAGCACAVRPTNHFDAIAGGARLAAGAVGAAAHYELAIERSGNQTLSSGAFGTR